MRKDVIYREDAIDAAKHAWAKGLEPTQYIEIVPSAQTKSDKDIVYKEDVLKLIRMMPPEEGITRALLIQSVEQLQVAEFMNEEIIYCPACKYSKGPYHNVRCTKYYGMGGPDDYCSMAERKEAIWLKKDLGGVEYTGVCSNCGYGSFWSEVKNCILCPNCGANMKVEDTNYILCPNCGADMREGGQDE
jgi:hypothetical protein